MDLMLVVDPSQRIPLTEDLDRQALTATPTSTPSAELDSIELRPEHIPSIESITIDGRIQQTIIPFIG
ncbi:MAG: hypothetical protein Q9190_008000 [Brigantiaea leucoxantha]